MNLGESSYYLIEEKSLGFIIILKIFKSLIQVRILRERLGGKEQNLGKSIKPVRRLEIRQQRSHKGQAQSD